jgi:hypothetical protein
VKTTALGQVIKDDIDEATLIERIKARVASMAEISNAISIDKNATFMALQMQQRIEALMKQLEQQVMAEQGGQPPEMAISAPEAMEQAGQGQAQMPQEMLPPPPMPGQEPGGGQDVVQPDLVPAAQADRMSDVGV